MLTQESRARSKQSEALKNERNKKYNAASSLYSTAKVIWQRVRNSKSKQDFCDSRHKQCQAMLVISEVDNDDQEIF